MGIVGRNLCPCLSSQILAWYRRESQRLNSFCFNFCSLLSSEFALFCPLAGSAFALIAVVSFMYWCFISGFASSPGATVFDMFSGIVSGSPVATTPFFAMIYIQHMRVYLAHTPPTLFGLPFPDDILAHLLPSFLTLLPFVWLGASVTTGEALDACDRKHSALLARRVPRGKGYPDKNKKDN
jgi:hypothetical protein